MREIKFRVWDKVSQSMEYEIAIGKGYGEDSYILFLGLGETFIIDADVIEIMQYSGLKDKNNVEIYEGDIVKVCNGSINGIGWEDKPYEVKWKPNKGWNLHLFLWDNHGENNMDSTHWIEVIGNIHENKELLAVVK